MIDGEVIEEGRVNSASGMRRLLTLVGILLFAIALVATLTFVGRASRPALAVTSGIKTERVLIAIEGMQCDGCATGIKAMLKRTPGVLAAEVSYERKEAVVDFDSGRITREQVVEAINNMGYRASIKG